MRGLQNGPIGAIIPAAPKGAQWATSTAHWRCFYFLILSVGTSGESSLSKSATFLNGSSYSLKLNFLAFRISLSCDISVLALCDICNSSSYVINFSRPYGWTSFCFSMRLALPASNYSKRRFFFYRFNATALFFHKHSLWFSIWSILNLDFEKTDSKIASWYQLALLVGTAYRKTPVSIFTSNFSWKKPRRRTSARHYTSERMYEKEETHLRRAALSMWNRSGKDAIWIFLALQILYRGKPHAHHDYGLL